MVRVLACLGLVALVAACDDDPKNRPPGPTGGQSAMGGGGVGGIGGDEGGGGVGGMGGQGGIGGGTGGEGGEAFVPLDLTSVAFNDGEVIPEVHECDAAGGSAQNLSPALAWTGGSSQVGSWAVVGRDIDADDGGVVQWVIWNIPAATMQLPEGIVNAAMPPEVPGTTQAVSYDDVTVGYIGPCISGNRYRWSVFAMADPVLAGLDATTHRQIVANYVTNFSLGAGHLLGQND